MQGYKSFHVIYFAILMFFSATGCTVNNSSDATTSTSQAQELLEKYDLYSQLKTKSPLEAAKVLNSFVYNYCQAGTQTVPSSELFNTCVTACGGFSYVLINLLNSIGISAEYLNIYNIAIQGNHTMVEATIDGKHFLLDPTFGTYFQDTNNEFPLDYLTIYEKYKDNYSDLSKVIYQSVHNGIPTELSTSLNLYSQSFSSDRMFLESYVQAETYSYYRDDTIVSLSATVNINSYISNLNQKQFNSESQVEKAFLDFTNELLNAGDKQTFISYLFTFVGKYGIEFQPIIKLSSTLPDITHKYVLKINGFNPFSVPISYSISSSNSSVNFYNTTFYSSVGSFSQEILFNVTDLQSTNLNFILKNNSTNTYLRIYDIGLFDLGPL